MSRNWIIIIVVVLTVIMAGCTGSKKKTITRDGTEVEMNVPDRDDWCPTGASWQASNPGSGESTSMRILGKVTVSGVEMCKGTFESNVEEDFAMGEYLWSEDGETITWTFYDAAGKVVSKMEINDGIMTMTDDQGNVQTFDPGGST